MISDQQVVPTIRVQSWAELMDEIYRDSWDRELGRHRSPFVFRGISDARADLSTSLMRLAGSDYPNVGSLESHLLRNFRKYGHSAVEAAGLGNSIWNWLALAQHHGLHTRLLDWTYSPLVGAHFATDKLNSYGVDGAIWCLNHRQTMKYLPEPLRREAEGEGVNVFTAEMLDQVADSLERLDSLSGEEFVLFLEPPSLDQRIVSQFALFSLVSNPERRLDDWLVQHPGVAKKIIVPASLKWEVRDKLDQAGITERMLLPGLDGLSRWLSRYYMPKTMMTRPPSWGCEESE